MATRGCRTDRTESICPIDDVRASAEYRSDMAAMLCRRMTVKLFDHINGRAS